MGGDAGLVVAPEQTAAHGYVFRLYVAGHGVRSAAAESNLRLLCDSCVPEDYSLEVIDTIERPDLAAQQRISATPALVRLSPVPQVRIIGDLSDLDGTAAFLGLPAATSTLAEKAAAASADGIIAIDDNGIIRYCNAAAAELFARPTQQLVGQPFGFPVAAGQPTEIDLVQSDNRTLTVDMRVTTATLDGASLRIATLRDITSDRQADLRLKAALDRQNVVVGVAAHELNNPLFAIRVLVDTLREHRNTLSTESRDDITDRIGDRIAALQELLRKLLTAARIDTESARPTAQRVPVLETLLERLAQLGDRSQQVSLSCPAELAVLVDRDEFTEMIDNYLDNAFTHGRPPIEVRATEHDGWVEVRVYDHGPGIPDTFAPQLFQRFCHRQSGQHDTEGAGLGLWIVASLAETNGGRAWYEPNPGGGSCFCLRLCRAPD